MPARIMQKDIAQYPGWVICWKLAKKGARVKLYKHRPTGVYVKTVPEILRIINLHSEAMPEMVPDRLVSIKLRGVVGFGDSVESLHALESDSTESGHPVSSHGVMVPATLPDNMLLLSLSDDVSECAGDAAHGIADCREPVNATLTSNATESDTTESERPVSSHGVMVPATLPDNMLLLSLSDEVSECADDAASKIDCFRGPTAYSCASMDEDVPFLSLTDVGRGKSDIPYEERLVPHSVPHHIQLLDDYLEKFRLWRNNGMPASGSKCFVFCGQTSSFITNAFFNLSQCMYYDIPLLSLASMETQGEFTFVQPPLSLCFTLKALDSRTLVMHMTTTPSESLIRSFASFSHGRRDLFTHLRNRKETEVDFFEDKFSQSGMSFIYVTAGGEIVSLLTYFTYRSSNGVSIVDILTTQADNNRAAELVGSPLSKGLGDRMFVDGLIKTMRYNGGGHIYAVCLNSGNTGKIWRSHPMQPTNIATFIWLQLAMAAPIEYGCTPMSMEV